jgi:hypothetical protein
MSAYAHRRALLRITLAVMFSIFAEAGIAHAFDWMINEDYRQPDARNATDFEFYLQGNVTGQITDGGFTSVTNAFPDPTRSTSVDAFGNTTVRFVGSNTIPTSPAPPALPDRHFGIFGTGVKPRVLTKAWSYPTTPTRVPVPKSNFAIFYNATSSTLQITLENTSPDTVTFQDAGYLTSATEHPIEDLRRSVLPPSSFVPLPALNHQYHPGDSSTVNIPGVTQSSYVVTFASASFSGSSASNLYTGTAGEWAQFRVAAHTSIQPAPPGMPGLRGWLLIVLLAFPAVAGAVVLMLRRRLPGIQG